MPEGVFLLPPAVALAGVGGGRDLQPTARGNAATEQSTCSNHFAAIELGHECLWFGEGKTDGPGEGSSPTPGYGPAIRLRPDPAYHTTQTEESSRLFPRGQVAHTEAVDERRKGVIHEDTRIATKGH